MEVRRAGGVSKQAGVRDRRVTGTEDPKSREQGLFLCRLESVELDLLPMESL